MLLAAVVAGLTWAAGLRTATVGLLALAVLVATALVVRADPPPDPVLPRPEPPPVPGARTDVGDLVWVLTTRGGDVGLGFHRRLQAAAHVRLRAVGVDPDDAASVVAALGPAVAATLGTAAPPRTGAAVAALDALERLRPAGAPPGGPTTAKSTASSTAPPVARGGTA
ncbi:hypothetical protein Cma02nite_25970 [Cellulomonas marina]|uniref:Uncharacterized protein n=1 Tax=Cellulomonas marina TaxID=988821 RepID=A0A1I0W508_9CELL|nr:hypothetical protein Cma02nite_25970 [Cellulomonas marina]SFA83641.1 hypothetical protein SAMN05421867_102180 [Cellulomonas marina]